MKRTGTVDGGEPAGNCGELIGAGLSFPSTRNHYSVWRSQCRLSKA